MRNLAIIAIVGCVAPLAWAHQLVPDDGTHIDASLALEVEDVSISQVIYHTVAEEGEALWVTFSAEAGEDVYLQLGVPVIEGLEDYRPALLLLGPGLPDIETPPGVPESMGGVLLEPEGQPEEFYERFTGTASWILLEEDTTVPQSGQFYVVAYHPESETGKLWVSWGREEVFGLRDLVTYADVLQVVRTFHEVDDEPLPFLPRFLLTISRIARFFGRLFGAAV
ncbi:MAG: hypothetical protein R6V12_13105 [Candidatus Hydrogenedentota bacterium]